LDGYPDASTGEDHIYLLLPAGEVSDAFLKALDAAQVGYPQPVRFPDDEKLIYLRIHRLYQV
jgi:hypothetical protein